ncbi:MAG: MBOAT family protein [Clostridia bacterium]|nr:MBOAT family protein [Clostridia bacterium]
MVFSSLEFLFLFLPLVALLYFIFPVKLRNGLLLCASLFFYAWGEPVYLFVMLGSIVMNYVFGLLIGKASTPGRKKAALAVGVAGNVLLLGAFKYTGFFAENLSALTGLTLPIKEIALPIGISFFTFQAMSYIIDVYRGNAQAQKNPLDFGLYISLFPQLIAGPIVRYSTVAGEIKERHIDFSLAADGIKRFVTGLAKKALLANSAGLVWDTLTKNGAETSAVSAWTAALMFSFQIYFDFSGYSDMAIGLGRIFGFHFEENFNYPYVSRSVTEFWRRWHISLGTWFREYLYIPLGGNRKGTGKQIRNILIVWLLTGLWHGASWNFVLWGAYYGVLLLLEKLFLKKFTEKLPVFLRHILTLLAVLFGWVLFAFDDIMLVPKFIGSMIGLNGLSDAYSPQLAASNAALTVILALASLPLGKILSERFKEKIGEKSALFGIAETAWFIILFILSVAFIVEGTYNPFIYFRF